MDINGNLLISCYLYSGCYSLVVVVVVIIIVVVVVVVVVAAAAVLFRIILCDDRRYYKKICAQYIYRWVFINPPSTPIICRKSVRGTLGYLG